MKKAPMKTVWILTILAGLGSQGVPASGQEINQDGVHRIRGDALPAYFCATAFYERGFLRYADSRAAYEGFLEEIGILPGTSAAEAVTRTILKARILKEQKLDLTAYIGDPEQHDEAQRAWLRQQVEDLREMHQGLLSSLRLDGVDTQKMLDYMDTTIRASTSIHTFGGPADAWLLEIVEEFERREP